MQTTRDLTKLYSHDDDPIMHTDAVEHQVRIDAFEHTRKNRITTATYDQLVDAIINYEQLCAHGAGKPFVYRYLKQSLDQLNPGIAARYGLYEESAKKQSNQIAFFSLDIAKISIDIQQKLLDTPGLPHHRLERIRATAQYDLTEPEEKIITSLSSGARSKRSTMLESLLSKEHMIDSKPYLIEQCLGDISDTDQHIRDTASAHVNEILARHTLIAEHEINAILSYKKTIDDMRGYPRPDTSRHIGDDMDTASIDTLISTVAANYGLCHRFYALKAKLLNKTQLAYHERNVPIGTQQEIDYDSAYQIVHTSLTKINPQFATRFEQMHEGHIDVYPRVGKTSGAYCAYFDTIRPFYILLNYTSKSRDVMTLAHEMGHCLNNYMMTGQKSLSFETPMSTAEVASTFFEDFAMQEMLGDQGDDQKLALMMLKLGDEVSTIFRQVAAYQFETALHHAYRERGYLGYAEIGEIFGRHMASYMGESVAQSVGSQNRWIHRSHFRSYFYVYSYASGLLISKSLQKQYRSDHQFLDKIQYFLAAGSSESPQQLFAKMGIDSTQSAFWQQGCDEFEQLLAQAEQLADKVLAK